MTATGALVLLAATVGVLLWLGGWIGRCIHDNLRTADRDDAALRLSRRIVDDFNLLGGAG